MSKLEDDLRQALRREEPPEGFADRVLARLPAAEPAKVVEMRPRPRPAPLWAAAAAAAVVAAGALWMALPQPGPPVNLASNAAGPPVVEVTPPPVEVTQPDVVPENEPPKPRTIVRTNTGRHRRRAQPARPAAAPILEAERRAAEQFVLAMQITSAKLEPVQKHLLAPRAVPET